MMQTIIQLLSGALGSIGFGLLFHLNRRYLIIIFVHDGF